MCRGRRAIAILLGGALVAGAAAAEPLEASRGRWSGPVQERTQGSPATAKVELRVEGNGERFNVELKQAGGVLLSGDFQSGERKDVFGPPAGRGVRALLGRSAVVKPLEGHPLAWARRTADAVIVYRLELRDGAHRLDRMTLVPGGGRVRVEFERREHGNPAQRFTATLERGTP